jgi:uncharacterized membrane protein YidH (DUF202 family)
MTPHADPPDPPPKDNRDHADDDPAARDPAARRPEDRELEERDPGLARERTSLAWTRTAIAFAALGGVVLKANVITGLIILAIAPLVWQLGRVTRSGSPPTGLPAVGTIRIRLITLSIVAVALLSLLVAVLGHSDPGALR